MTFSELRNNLVFWVSLPAGVYLFRLQGINFFLALVLAFFASVFLVLALAVLLDGFLLADKSKVASDKVAKNDSDNSDNGKVADSNQPTGGDKVTGDEAGDDKD